MMTTVRSQNIRSCELRANKKMLFGKSAVFIS